MTNGYFRYYKRPALISLLTILAVSIFLAKNYWGVSFSIISAISVLLIVIDKWLWKVPIFSLLFWVDNFSGRYEGELEYEFRNADCQIQKGKLKHVKIIHQSGSEITVYSFTIKPDGTPSSLSESQGIYVRQLAGEQHYELIYTYRNEGSTEQGFGPHYGTEIIKFVRKGNSKMLFGRYFTERIPFSTKGKFNDLRWVSNNQEHEF